MKETVNRTWLTHRIQITPERFYVVCF